MTNSASPAAVSGLAHGETRHYDNGAGVTMELRQHSHVGYRIEVRKDGVMVEGHTLRTETEALTTWRALIAQHRAEQETFTAALPNGVTVAMTSERIAGNLVHRVQTTQGGVVEAWTRSYDERHLAVEAAARAAATFRAHGTAEAIERRAEELRRDNLRLLYTRRALTFNEKERQAAIERELDRLADLNTPTGTAALAAVA